MDTPVGSRGLWNVVCMQPIYMFPRGSWWPPFLPKAPHQPLPCKEPSNSHCCFNEFATYLVLSGKTRLQSSMPPARTQVYFLHWLKACLRFGFLRFGRLLMALV